MKSIMEERQEPVTWDVFRRKFLSEYFPDSVKYAKGVEFLKLTQGRKFVTKYVEKFKHLSCFYTMPLDEEWRCRKFENGLHGDLRLVVALLSIKDFTTLVEKARVMEKMKVEVETQHPHQPRVEGPFGSRHRHEERRKPYTRPHFQSQGSRESFSQQSRIQCYQCGGLHKRNVCPQLAGFKRCKNCGKKGHFGRDCPTLARAITQPLVQTPVQNQQRHRDNRPQAIGRVYAMTGTKVASSGNLVISHCMIARKACCVLYDSGATHLFVSDACVKKLSLPVCEL